MLFSRQHRQFFFDFFNQDFSSALASYFWDWRCTFFHHFFHICIFFVGFTDFVGCILFDECVWFCIMYIICYFERDSHCLDLLTDWFFEEAVIVDISSNRIVAFCPHFFYACLIWINSAFFNSFDVPYFINYGVVIVRLDEISTMTASSKNQSVRRSRQWESRSK